MAQIVLSYEGQDSVSNIERKIKRECEKNRMYVKSVSLSSDVHGYNTYYSALVVLENEVKTNGRD